MRRGVVRLGLGILIGLSCCAAAFAAYRWRRCADARAARVAKEQRWSRNLRKVHALLDLYTREWCSNANLSGEDLRLQLSTDSLQWPVFSGVDFTRSDLRGAQLARASLREVRFKECDLRGASLAGALLWDCDLSGARLGGTNLSGTIYSGRTRWPDGFDPRANGASLLGPGTILRRMYLAYLNLSRVDLRGADVRGAILRGSVLDDADLRGARLSRAQLGSARYNSGTRWPTGFDPRARGATMIGDDAAIRLAGGC